MPESTFDPERTDSRHGQLRVRPVGQGKACLIMMTGPFPGETYLLPPGTDMTIGRGPGNDIRLPYPEVSRLQAKAKCSASGKVELTDLGSTNGTFVNGRRQMYRVLREGDKIQFGEGTILRFAFHDELDEEFQRRLFGTPFLDRASNTLNRDRLLSSVDETLTESPEQDVAVIAMAIDGFDLLEELLGHAVRDYFLRELSWLIRKSVAGEATIYRVSGQGFASVFLGLSAEEAAAAADRIQRVVNRSRITYEGDQMVFTLGMGVACANVDQAHDAAQLLELAESRCQRARDAGGNRIIEAGA